MSTKKTKEQNANVGRSSFYRYVLEPNGTRNIRLTTK